LREAHDESEYMHDRESGKFPLREFACSVFYRLLVPKGGAKSIRQGEIARSARRIRIVKNREKGTATVPPLRNAGASLSAQCSTAFWCQKVAPKAFDRVKNRGAVSGYAQNAARTSSRPRFLTAEPSPSFFPIFHDADSSCASRKEIFLFLRKMSAASFGHSLCRSVKKTYI